MELNPDERMIGQIGGAYLRTDLSRRNPTTVIAEFQTQNSLSTNIPAFPLLDLHGISRSDIYQTIMLQLKDKLLSRVDALGSTEINALLLKTFPFVQFPEIRPIVMTLLKKHALIPAAFLETLGSTPELYADCPLEVKRQIWCKKPKLFKDAALTLLDAYAAIDMFQNIPTDPSTTLPTALQRRQHQSMREIVHVIGDSFDLYNLVLQHVRMRFLKSNNTAFCTLRTDLVMSMYEAGATNVYPRDPCHKFAWSLSSCVKDKALDQKRLKELCALLSTAPKEAAVWGDLFMMLADPFVAHALLRYASVMVKELPQTKVVPRDHESLRAVLTLLQAGLDAHSMIESRQFRAPAVPVVVITQFLPALLLITMDAQKDVTNIKIAKQTSAGSQLSIPESVQPLLKSEVLAQKLAIIGVLESSRAYNWDVATNLLTSIVEHCPHACDEHTIKSVFASCLEARDVFMSSPTIPSLFEHVLIPLSSLSHALYIRTLLFLVALQHPLRNAEVASVFIPRLCKEGAAPPDVDSAAVGSIHSVLQSLSILYHNTAAAESIQAAIRQYSHAATTIEQADNEVRPPSPMVSVSRTLLHQTSQSSLPYSPTSRQSNLDYVMQLLDDNMPSPSAD